MSSEKFPALLFCRMTGGFALAALVLFNNGQRGLASNAQQYGQWVQSARAHLQMMEPEKAISDLTEAI